jgi:hypothetical protein
VNRLSSFVRKVARALTPPVRRNVRTDAAPDAPPLTVRTRLIAPPGANGLKISYAPDADGDADAGEIVWTWVPYAEGDGRGKDRPVLVIGRQDADHVYAVRLTSQPHDGEGGYIAIGSGAWDGRARASWVDIEQLYSVHRRGMRREAAALDLDRFVLVANALRRRYGWDAERRR